MTSWTLGMFFIEGQGRRLERHLIILLQLYSQLDVLAAAESGLTDFTAAQRTGETEQTVRRKEKIGRKKIPKNKKNRVYLLPPDSIPQFAAVA